MGSRSLFGALTALAVGAASCGGGADGGADEVLVFAAASLTDVMSTIEEDHERRHPGVDVVVSVAGTQVLREQILAGAPADVFVAADPAAVDLLVDAGATAGAPSTVATNTLVIAVPAGNPGAVTDEHDLADPGRLVGLCVATAPCGALADQALAEAEVTPSVDTRESDVRALLGRVAAGELDAGVVYGSDVAAAAGDVEPVPFQTDVEDVRARYVAVILGDAGDRAATFVAELTAADAQDAFAAAGFAAP